MRLQQCELVKLKEALFVLAVACSVVASVFSWQLTYMQLPGITPLSMEIPGGNLKNVVTLKVKIQHHISFG